MGKEKRKIRIAAIAYMFMFAAIFCIVSAGNMVETKAASTQKKIEFRDKSGSYLCKSGENWYLRDSKKKKLTGLQYLAVTPTDFLHAGIYIFDQNGRLIRKRAVYHFRKTTVQGVTFDGYYVSDSNGRFSPGEKGFVKIAEQKLDGKIFGGVYYAGERGKLNCRAAGIRYVKARKLDGRTLKSGYYYFSGYGRICFYTHFHKMNITVNGKKYNGNYYFGGGNGRLTQKAGWITYGSRKYYVDKTGKMAVSCWKDGYYLKSNGTIAKNMKTPDGKYVDYQGKKSTKSEYALSEFKAQLKNYTSGYGGNWSVYVKDLKTGNVINLNDQAMYPASTIKLL